MLRKLMLLGSHPLRAKKNKGSLTGPNVDLV